MEISEEITAAVHGIVKKLLPMGLVVLAGEEKSVECAALNALNVSSG